MGLFRKCKVSSYGTSYLTLDGRFKYNPSTFSRVLFPPRPQKRSNMLDSSIYHSERPRKRRKLAAGSQGTEVEDEMPLLEIEGTEASEVMLLRMVKDDSTSEEKAERRWDVWIEARGRKDEPQAAIVNVTTPSKK